MALAAISPTQPPAQCPLRYSSMRPPLLYCVCVSVAGALFSLCVCVDDLLIFLHRRRGMQRVNSANGTVG